MSKRKQGEKVLVRVWQDSRGDDVFALFPEIPASSDGRYCTCYQTIGQHGSADYGYCIKQSRPAAAKETAPLLKELRLIGYKPVVIKRASPRALEIRRKAVEAMK